MHMANELVSPAIAATILNSGVTTLYNVPNIQDVQTMYEIIKDAT